MWKIKRFIGLSLLKEPVKLLFLLLKHNKKAVNVASSYNISYGENKLQKYDIHAPVDKAIGTVFYIHGGSWMSVDKKYYNYIMKTIAEAGIRVVNINYRLIPKVTLDEVVIDCEMAILHALSNYKEIDKSKLLIAGDSAGAHLAALIAAKANCKNLYDTLNFRAAGLFYGLYDFKEMYDSNILLFKFLEELFFHELGADYKEILKIHSPIEYFNEKFPPSFLASGKKDVLNCATMSFIKMLEENNIEHKAIIYDKKRKDGLHGFLNLYFLKSSKECTAALIEFFKSQL